MGLKVGESFKDRVFITTSTGIGKTGLTPTCTVIDESGNRSVGAVVEEGSGWYTCTFTPDAAGIWATEWAVSIVYIIHYPYKIFKVGGGQEENAEDSGNLTHDITTINDLVETQMVEIAKAGIYALSVFIDLDVLEAAVEGGVVKIRLYNKIDGTNYSDIPTAYSEYVVGSENEYPSIEANMLHGNCKLTIQCSNNVSVTRTIAYRYIVKDLGA